MKFTLNRDEYAEADILVEVFAYEANGKTVELPVDINIKPDRLALPVKIKPSGSQIGVLKKSTAGQKTGILKSSGESINSAEITYSVEIYEIE